MRRCLYCENELTGRVDKKFCSPYCKSAYHYEKSQQNEPSFYSYVDQQLKNNRRILKSYNKAGKSTVVKQTFIDEGFNPNFFTHYWKAKNGNLYLFCYEYGYMSKKENNKEKYILITWQEYMNKKNH